MVIPLPENFFSRVGREHEGETPPNSEFGQHCIPFISDPAKPSTSREYLSYVAKNPSSSSRDKANDWFPTLLQQFACIS
jgi:hypothetical protein